MKKIVKCFSYLLLAIVIVACSSDDNSTDGNENRELILTADKLKVSIGETISFSALDESNKEVKDVELYVNGAKISQKHKFDKKGMYYAIAKKKGYKNSRPIDIAVMDADGEVILSKLKLSVDKSSVFIGDQVTFEVKIDGKVATSGYQLRYYQGEVINSNTVVLDKPGTFKFVVTKNDYATSDIIEVDVKLKSTVTPQTFTINGKKYDVRSVDLVLDVDSHYQAILYNDAKGSFFAYAIVLSHSYVTFSAATLKVYVPKFVDDVVYPHEVDKSKISLWKGESFVDTVIVNNIIDSQISKESTVKFSKALNGDNGELELDFKANDYSLEMKYSGTYNILNMSRSGNKTSIVRM